MSVPPSCQNQTQVECPTELLSTVWKFQSNGMPLCPVNVMYADRRSGNRSLSTDVRRSNVCDSADRWIGVWTFGGYCHSCVALWFIMASPQAGDIRSITALLHRCITTPSSTLSTDKIMLLFSSAERLLRCHWFMPRAHKEASRAAATIRRQPACHREKHAAFCLRNFYVPTGRQRYLDDVHRQRKGKGDRPVAENRSMMPSLASEARIIQRQCHEKKRLSHSADN